MARGATKGGKRSRPNARQQQQQRSARRSSRRELSPTEQSLFFTRIRRQAKWAYVVLAVLFAITFAALGVGSGQGGLDQLFNQVFRGGSTGSSVSSLQKKVEKQPKNAKAWHDLALAYQSKSRLDDAAGAMSQYTSLRAKDPAGWSQLGQIQAAQADVVKNEFVQAQNLFVAWQIAAYQPFAPTGKLASAAGTNPAVQSLQTQSAQAQSIAAGAEARARDAYLQAIASLQHAAKLQPKQANLQLEIVGISINALQQLQDRSLAKPALEAYQRLVKIDPANAKQYKAKIKQLKAILGPTGR